MSNNAPKVTGISPKDGVPRTKLTIRGENLGVDPEDVVSLRICDIECIIFMDWISPQKIITRSPHLPKGSPSSNGDVIVTTKRGGVGISMVQFTPIEEPIGLTTPSGVWVDESELFLEYRRPTSPSIGGGLDDGGFTGSGEAGMMSSPGTRVAKLPFDKPFSALFPELNPAKVVTYSDITSEQFHPAIYLLENKAGVSFASLKDFYEDQRARCTAESKNTLNSNGFLKANVLSIIDCLNALNAFYLAFKKDKQESGNAEFTLKLEETLKSASAEAHAIFDTIIARKDKSDSTRNALNVLQRYRFLFNLPSNIERSMQKADYDVVLNDYFRAKNLFAGSSVAVFRRVYLEVEERIRRFRRLLEETFTRYCSSVEEEGKNMEELKKLIKYLSVLGSGDAAETSQIVDPAWEAVTLIKRTLFNRIASAKETYLKAKEAAKSKKTTIIISASETTTATTPEANETPPPEVAFIEEVTSLFSVLFTDLHKLGSAYLAGELSFASGGSNGGNANGSPNRTSSPEYLARQGELFTRTVLIESIELLCAEFRTVLQLPESRFASVVNTSSSPSKGGADGGEVGLDDRLVRWLPKALRSSVACYGSLLSLDYTSVHLVSASAGGAVNPSPHHLLKPLQTFIFELRLHTIKALFSSASAEIRALAGRESWAITLDDLYGVRTTLPLLFEAKFTALLALIRDSVLDVRVGNVCSGGKSASNSSNSSSCGSSMGGGGSSFVEVDEVDLFSQINVKGEVKILAQAAILAFLHALERSVVASGTEPTNSSTSSTSSSAITADNRALVVLCNASYTANYVLPKLQEAFDRLGYPDMTATLGNAQRKFKELEHRLLNAFIGKKRDAVIGRIEQSMYAGSVGANDWTTSKEMPKEVSSYIKETLLNLIFVQAEIYQITPQLVNKTMYIILVATIEEIERLYDIVSARLSDHARVQMLIDINALDTVLRGTGPKYYGRLKPRIDNCRAIASASVKDPTIRKIIDDVTGNFCDSMRLQICCFHFDAESLLAN